MNEEQKQISENIINYHPNNPIVFEMQRRFREIEESKEN